VPRQASNTDAATPRPRRWLALLFLVGASLFWAVNFVVGEVVVRTINPLSLTFLRWAGAAILLVIIAQVIERPDWRAVLRRWPTLLLLGVVGLLGYGLLLYEALRHTTAVSAGLISAANPALIAVAAAVMLSERLTVRRIVGLLVSLLGVTLVVTKGSLDAILRLDFNVGDLLMLGAIAAWTVYTVIVRRTTGMPPMAALAAQAVLGTIVFAPFAFGTGLQLPAAPEAWAGLAVIVLLPSVGSYLLWNLALRDVTATTAGISLNLLPVFTVAISLALGATMGLADGVGGLLALGGVLLATVERRKRDTGPVSPDARAPRRARTPAG
jgi:drug/metabolite transporter (DMT)-like permease